MIDYVEIVGWCGGQDRCSSFVNEEYEKLKFGRGVEDQPRLEWVKSIDEIKSLLESEDIISWFSPIIIIDSSVDIENIINILNQIADLFDPIFFDNNQIKCIIGKDFEMAGALTEHGYRAIIR